MRLDPTLMSACIFGWGLFSRSLPCSAILFFLGTQAVSAAASGIADECGYAASEGNLESASLSRASLLLRPEYGTGDEVAGEKEMDAAELVLVERQGTESIRSQSRSQTLAKSNPWEPRVLRESKTRLAFSWEEEVLAGSSARYDALEETVALEVPADGSREAEAGAVSGALEVQGISLPPTETPHAENGDEASVRHSSLSSALPAPIPLTPDSVPSKHASKHWTPTPPSGQGKHCISSSMGLTCSSVLRLT